MLEFNPLRTFLIKDDDLLFAYAKYSIALLSLIRASIAGVMLYQEK